MSSTCFEIEELNNDDWLQEKGVGIAVWTLARRRVLVQDVARLSKLNDFTLQLILSQHLLPDIIGDLEEDKLCDQGLKLVE